MGIIRAVHGAIGSVIEEQFKEFFMCEGMGSDTLLVQAFKRVGSRSANTRKDDNMLTNGSILSVADGQCVLVVKQGKVIDFCAEPGEHIFEDPEQGGLKGFFREVGKRVSFGGGDIQPTVYRVYYMNVKEISGNPFHTVEPIPFRVRDEVSGLDLDSSVMLGGVFSYRVSDPVKLYKTIIGNIKGRFTRKDLSLHLHAELMKYLQPSLTRLSELGLRPNELPDHVPELCDILREKMNEGWCGEHGAELGSIALSGFQIVDADKIQSAQHAAVLRDHDMAAATMVQTVSQAMPAAAGNASGAMPFVAAIPSAQYAGSSWTCSCGRISDRAFCPDCGKPRPLEWTCSCGQINKGKFCQNCGRKKPE